MFQNFLLFFLGLSFSAQAGTSVECPKNLQPVFDALSKIAKKPSPWKSISSFHVGLKESVAEKTQLYLFGYLESQLKAAGLNAVACKDYSSVFSIENPSLILSAKLKSRIVVNADGSRTETTQTQQGGQWIYPKNWRKDFPDGSQLQLVDDAKFPLYVIDYGLWKTIPLEAIKKNLENPGMISNVMLHELFHAYQHSFSEPRWKDTDWDVCVSNAEWKNALETELRDWKIVLKSPELVSAEENLKLVKKILNRREQAVEGAMKDCWRALERRETVEGTATFFGDRSVESGGFSNPIKQVDLWGNRELTVENVDIFSSGAEFFYMTGVYLSRMAELRDPTLAWQTKIEQGETVAAALRAIP